MTPADKFIADVTKRLKDLYDVVEVDKTYKLGIAGQGCPIYYQEYKVFSKTRHSEWSYALGCKSDKGVIYGWIRPSPSFQGTRQIIVSIEEVTPT